MNQFLVKVIYENGKPAEDIGVKIDYGWLGGTDEKRTHSDGWAEFQNRRRKSGTIFVHGQKMGTHVLEDGIAYYFII